MREEQNYQNINSNHNINNGGIFSDNIQIFGDVNSSFNSVRNVTNNVDSDGVFLNTNVDNSNVNLNKVSNQINGINNYASIDTGLYNQNSNVDNNNIITQDNSVNQNVFVGNDLYNQKVNVFAEQTGNNVDVIDSESSLDNNQDDNNKDKSNWIVSFITNRRFLLVIIILIFIFTSITVGRTIYLKNKVDNYEEFFVDIEYKQSNETIIYNNIDEGVEDLKTGAADELVKCIKTPLDINDIPDSIGSIIEEINSYYNQSNNHFSFKYKDIYTGFSVSYNENQSIFVASTIKAPKDIYLYEMASLGKIDLNTKLTYTNNYYNTGSGILRNNKFGTEYTVKELLRYSTVISDNAAHNMLMDKYGRENMLAFWKEKGTNAIFTQYGNWGVFNAHDAIIYMEELYNFYIENETYGQELMNNFLNASPKFINRKDGTKIANKSGWGGSAIHDVSIIFDENPYIIAALSNLGETNTYMNYFNKVSDLAQRLHTEYWKYKMDICGNIDQY